ncbi:hypothetical protein E2C00_16990 [Streptomyces sp. WAC05374]|uniref:hypothetical protein n=1 Tax=Streptomyces sp. WAC05374 TaxID=2487420 RepID=UPI000F86AE2A|nr:hypothetical protein [Streptomyces sp. WAC05374]RST12025.1 hypothetical protein EF905_23660 [Streptomyces sp. WAC05374]TDF54618.1 hypothetical protein E2C00_16990 [Streptomyces sp. WAC05374]TDF56253.1 hypothetical protein E2C02_12445 [Streptomyces sp. WAC05374]
MVVRRPDPREAGSRLALGGAGTSRTVMPRADHSSRSAVTAATYAARSAKSGSQVTDGWSRVTPSASTPRLSLQEGSLVFF